MDQVWEIRPAVRSNRWTPALLQAAAITLLLTGLFTYWFAVADRYVIFLYNHLGATPFDERTRSRYWMAGLVACGGLMLLDMLANWLVARVAGIRFRRYAPAAWWRVWLLCLPPLAILIPVITMTANQPPLPLADAGALLGATSIGLALALTPRSFAARRPSEFIWLILAGSGLVPSLLLLRAVELPAAGLAPAPQAYLMALGSTVAGAVWLALMSWLRPRWPGLGLAGDQAASRHFSFSDFEPGQTGEREEAMRNGVIPAAEVFVAGLCLSYLLLPLVHHLIFVPPAYRYISAAANFFAMRSSTQILSFLVAVLLSLGSAWLQRRSQRDPAGHLWPS